MAKNFDFEMNKSAMGHVSGALGSLAAGDRKRRMMELMRSKRPINKLESTGEVPAPPQDSNLRMDILSKMKKLSFKK